MAKLKWGILKRSPTLKIYLNAFLSLDSLLILFLVGRGGWVGTHFVASVDNGYETAHCLEHYEQ